MEGEVQEYTIGDVILVEAAIEPGSKIVGIKAGYKQEDSEEGSGGHIEFNEGESPDITYGVRRSREPVPGPYLEGIVTLDYTVPTEQPEGTYHLYFLQFVTANRTLVRPDELPSSSFRIVPQTLGPPTITGWELSKG